MRGDEQSVTNSGRLFHARAPATAKALSPSDERRVAGTTRADDDADRVTAVDGATLPQEELVHSSDSTIPFVRPIPHH